MKCLYNNLIFGGAFDKCSGSICGHTLTTTSILQDFSEYANKLCFHDIAPKANLVVKSRKSFFELDGIWWPLFHDLYLLGVNLYLNIAVFQIT